MSKNLRDLYVAKITASAPEVLLPDRPIAFNRDFVRLGIGIKGALFLSQALYWSKRTNDPDGWFYKTVEEWEEETGLTKEEQLTIKKSLRDKGLMEFELRGVPARNHYRLNQHEIANCLVESLKIEITQMSGTPTTGSRLSRQQAVGNPDNIQYAESTTKSTTDTSSSGFLIFWQAYPKKIAKPTALKSWQRLNLKRTDVDKLLAGLNEWKSSDQWERDGGRYIPHPATFLNQRRWEDEVPKKDLGFISFNK